MTRRPTPGTRRWRSLVTASKVAAIAGVSTYDSPMSMWLKMRGDIPWQAGTAVTQRGHDLEAAVLGWWRREHGLKARDVRRQVFVQHPDLPWAAATLDGLAGMLGEAVEGASVPAQWFDRRLVIVEAKTSRKPEEWGAPLTDAIPVDYLTQAFWGMAMCPGVDEVRVPVLLSGLEFAEYVVRRDEQMQDELVDLAGKFYRSLDGDRPPLDDHVATRDALRALHPDIDRGETAFLLDDALGYEYLGADANLAIAERWHRGASIRVLDAMGRANYAANTSGVRVARRQPGRGGTVALHAVHPKGSKA